MSQVEGPFQDDAEGIPVVESQLTDTVFDKVISSSTTFLAEDHGPNAKVTADGLELKWTAKGGAYSLCLDNSNSYLQSKVRSRPERAVGASFLGLYPTWLTLCLDFYRLSSSLPPMERHQSLSRGSHRTSVSGSYIRPVDVSMLMPQSSTDDTYLNIHHRCCRQGASREWYPTGQHQGHLQGLVSPIQVRSPRLFKHGSSMVAKTSRTGRIPVV